MWFDCFVLYCLYCFILFYIVSVCVNISRNIVVFHCHTIARLNNNRNKFFATSCIHKDWNSNICLFILCISVLPCNSKSGQKKLGPGQLTRSYNSSSQSFHAIQHILSVYQGFFSNHENRIRWNLLIVSLRLQLYIHHWISTLSSPPHETNNADS